MRLSVTGIPLGLWAVGGGGQLDGGFLSTGWERSGLAFKAVNLK